MKHYKSKPSKEQQRMLDAGTAKIINGKFTPNTYVGKMKPLYNPKKANSGGMYTRKEIQDRTRATS